MSHWDFWQAEQVKSQFSSVQLIHSYSTKLCTVCSQQELDEAGSGQEGIYKNTVISKKEKTGERTRKLFKNILSTTKT